MAHPDWTRWIHSSVAKFFRDLATSNSLPMLIEGVEERTTAFMQTPNRVEVRMNGPFTREISANYHRIYVDINVVVTTRKGAENTDPYLLDRTLGLIHEAMDGVIPIFRYGTGPDDDREQIGCLSLRTGKLDNLRVLHFGQIN